MTRIVILLALSVALVFTHGADAAASVTVYTNKPAWVAAVNSAYATETFDSGPFGTYGSISLSSGIDIIATNHGFIPNTSLTWHDQVTAGTEFTTFNFLQPIKAFGGDWDLTSYWIGTPNPLRLSLDGARRHVDHRQWLLRRGVNQPLHRRQAHGPQRLVPELGRGRRGVRIGAGAQRSGARRTGAAGVHRRAIALRLDNQNWGQITPGQWSQRVGRMNASAARRRAWWARASFGRARGGSTRRRPPRPTTPGLRHSAK